MRRGGSNGNLGPRKSNQAFAIFVSKFIAKGNLAVLFQNYLHHYCIEAWYLYRHSASATLYYSAKTLWAANMCLRDEMRAAKTHLQGVGGDTCCWFLYTSPTYTGISETCGETKTRKQVF